VLLSYFFQYFDTVFLGDRKGIQSLKACASYR